MKQAASDTIHVTYHGRTIVDARKLLAKPAMQKLMAEMRAKTVVRRKPIVSL